MNVLCRNALKCAVNAVAIFAAVVCAASASRAQIASEINEQGKLVYVNADAPLQAFARIHGAGGQSARAEISPRIDAMLQSAASRNQLDPALVRAVVRQESAGNPAAISPKGAQGLMQLMPATASRFGVANAFDPASNLDGGAKYLRALLDRYDGDLSKSLAAYNAGEGAVDARHGIPPFSETQNYVRSVLNSYSQSGAARNFANIRFPRWPIRQETDAGGKIVFTNE